MFQSGTFPVLDGTFVDIATTGKKNNYWYSSANPTIQTSDDGTTLTEVTNGVAYLISTVKNTTTWSNRRFINADFCIEFDLSNVENTKFVFYGVTGTPQLSLTDGHYKIKVTSTGITYSIDNGSETTLTSTEITNANVGFIDAGSSLSMKFTYKNFVVYPI